jgi:hypothetical protein
MASAHPASCGIRRKREGTFVQSRILVGAVAAGLLSGCGGTDGGSVLPPSGTASGSVTSAGGTLDAGGGFKLVIPSGALTQPTTVTINSTQQTAPAGFTSYSPLFTFEPAGLTFLKPVTVSFPVPAGVARPTIYWSTLSDPTIYDDNGGVVTGSVVETGVTHFSTGFTGQQVGAWPSWPAGGGTVTPVQFAAVVKTQSCAAGQGVAVLGLYAVYASPSAAGVCERVATNAYLANRDLFFVNITTQGSAPQPPIGVGTHPIGAGLTNAGITKTVACTNVSVPATAGSLIVDSITPTLVTGSIDFTLQDGRHVAGAISAPVCGVTRDYCPTAGVPPGSCIPN